MERATVHVDGVVQSVGFRPFVYRTALALDLDGTVRNLGDAGVRIRLEGPGEAVDAFLEALREENPPLAQVRTVDVDRAPVDEAAFSSFEILESEAGGEGGGTIPPDTAMCDACLADMRDPGSRYHGYWATSCVDCGPRFTVVHDLPYDRPATSMAAFPMCEACGDEYRDPRDRRHHAQTIACPDCGPRLAYAEDVDPPGDPSRPAVDERGPFRGLVDPASGGDAVEEAARRLAGGGIVVVKGIGGAHLACDAGDPAAVEALRDRTDRSSKPFAVMAPDLEAAEAVAEVPEARREALASPRRPILLLRRRDGPLAGDQVAPGLHTVGVMLPYSGLHHLLLDELEAPLVMTSANLPGQPMHVHNGEILAELEGVADGFLLHDRTIVARCDDSVGRPVAEATRWIRRSRGHVPVPVPHPAAPDEARVLALGPELDLAAAVLDGPDCYLTQYVGHVDDPATLAYLERAVDHLLSLTGLETPPAVACDLHPDFETTRLARELRDDEATGVEEVVQVQHHHAHAASVLAEHGRDAAVAVAVDGLGYGPDGTVWGGEVLDASLGDHERVAGLSPMRMPGGDRATRYPARMLAGALHPLGRGDLEALLAEHVAFPGGERERDVVLQQLAKGVNAPETTSAGRFLDAVSALLDLCRERSYEGEPAMRLEAAAARGEPLDVDVPRTQVDGRPAVDAPALLGRLVDRLEAGASGEDVAATAQETLATGLADLAVEAAAERGREAVALTGGVAYNEHVHRRVRDRMEEADLAFLANERVPPGDGGIAYGQAAAAAAQWAGRR